ncbi:MAG: saccharopine dehydrogenase NADP-binding domain-containing protein, partial [Marinobacter sp.]|nr:saccharopine dehydrogenase NADP-binding domain-containing protein [Marinobacter sp.]
MTNSKQADYDLVVFGATSFVGQILTRYLVENYGAAGKVKWAIAGRSEGKLNALKAELGAQAADLPVLVADAADDSALAGMCRQTRVVISTVGPYALYGEPLIKACVDTGTDYCDLTGEVQQHLGGSRVRCVALGTTDGLVRGMDAVDTGSALSVP